VSAVVAIVALAVLNLAQVAERWHLAGHVITRLGERARLVAPPKETAPGSSEGKAS
jgi:hypothetical protein